LATEMGIERRPMLASSASELVHEPRLIQAMMREDFYPHPCATVELFHTMTSWLLFAGDFVYKIKKPVRFSFVDAGTPAKRFQLCQAEAQLNERLAPKVYVGVQGVSEKLGVHALLPDLRAAQRETREFAVVMHRLPRERMLDAMVASGRVSFDDVRVLARRVAAFHRTASIAKSKVWGSAQAVSSLVLGNLAEAEGLAADSVTRDRLAVAGKYLRRYLRAHRQSLDNRGRDGYVRDGHGDLRCDCVCFSCAGLVIIDCVEYSEKLRYADTASEIASLALDLEFAHRPDLSEELVRAYVAETEDTRLVELLPFYKCYRAVLRGRLEMLLSLQGELPTERRILARSAANKFFELAASHVTAPRATLLS
jgi:aminoglycoside phosphotransferase family enzyme